jgi:hypothetical protein
MPVPRKAAVTAPVSHPRAPAPAPARAPARAPVSPKTEIITESQKKVSEIVAKIEKPKEPQMSSTPAPTTTPVAEPVPAPVSTPTPPAEPAPTPAVAPEVSVAEVSLENIKEPAPEVVGDIAKAAATAAEAAANAVVSSIASSVGIKIEGEFASKDTERVSSVIAEGIAFLRENAERIALRITNGESPMIVSAIELAQWAERTMKGFSGLERKDVVIRLLNWLIDNQEDVLHNALGENADELKRLVADVVPSVLDMVCAAAKGKLDLNIAKVVAKKCCVWWFGGK